MVEELQLEKKDNSLSKAILDKMATAIVPQNAIWIKDGQAQVNQNKIAHYEERKYQGDEVLWIAPKNCIRLEFEDTPVKNHRYILELESAAKSLGFDYCITGHGGKSDYFNLFNIKNIPLGEDNKNAKLLLIDLLMPSIAKDQLDRTNLGWTLSPVIEHQHWKPKYNGVIHKILRGKNPLDHNNEYPKELLKQLKRSKEKYKSNNIKTKQNNSWVEDFLIDFCCNNPLPKGSRHFIIEKNLAAYIIHRKDKGEIKEKYYKTQERKTDTLRTWETSILRGDYSEVYAGELANYIKNYEINFIIPKTPFKEENILLIKLDSYIENVKKFKNNQPFFYDEANMFWIWDRTETKYKMVDDTTMMILIDSSLGLDGQTVSSTIKNNYIEAFKRVGRMHIPKPAPKKWIQFKNKAFSLNSGKIHDVQPNFFFTNPIPWELGKNEDTPTMDKLITEWVGEKYKETAYQIIAYCCYNDYPIHLIFCLVGCGRNGKTTFLRLINKFIGYENICSTELDLLLDSRFESFKLYKKLVCMMGETNFGVLNKTSLLKRLTGQDLIGFEFKNKKPFDDYNYAKIMICSNSLPTTEDTSEGFYRRWLIIDFSRIFPEGKDILQIIPDIEYNNLALKITKILPKLLKIYTFKNQGTIVERTEKYILASNPLSHFIKEHCKTGFGLFMRYSELYIAYRKYLYDNKKRKIGYKEFNDVLALEGFEITRTTKKIGDNWISGKFIEGLELMQVMQLKNDISLRAPYRKSEWDSVHKLHKLHKEEEPTEIEELITPYISTCGSCGASPCNFYTFGKYFCSKDCIGSYKLNKGDTTK